MQAISRKALAFMLLLGCVGIAGVLVNLDSTHVRAQESKGNLPHVADLMNDAMQIHHTKLWLAGHASNWALATYEVRKIKETMGEVKEAIVAIQTSSPQWRNVSIGEMLQRVDTNLNSLEQAVEAKDANRFAASYRELTATCNACHMGFGQPQIKIIEPVANGTFVDQDFSAESGRQ
jgi:cytochrome c556